MGYEDLPQVHNQVPGHPERLPQPGFFNVAAMPDDKLIDLGRALYLGIFERSDTEYVLQHLGSDIAVMTSSEPERGRPLLDRLARSDDKAERYIAAAVILPFAEVDYEFSRDMLLTIHRLDHQEGDLDGMLGWYINLTGMLRESERHAQADDLDERWGRLWDELG